MAKNWTLSQFYSWVDGLFVSNNTRAIDEADFRDGLKTTAEFADDIRAGAQALNASFVARSLNNIAVVHVRGDTGNDTRTGVVDGTGSDGAVKTLARAIQLHTGKTQKLRIQINSGLVELTADTVIEVPDLTIMVQPGATLRFRKITGVKDPANVTVGEGNYTLRCYSNLVAVRVDGTLDVEGHNGTTGAGNQFFYGNAQGAIAICTSDEMIFGDHFQTINLTYYGTVTVGANATLFCYGPNGLNGYGSSRARYKRSYATGTLTLGASARESALETDKLVETLVFEGNGASKTVNIRRNGYPFTFSIVHNDGCTISTQPPGSCSANADNLLTFTGAVGKTLTVRLISNT